MPAITKRKMKMTKAKKTEPTTAPVNTVVVSSNPWSTVASALDEYIGPTLIKFTKDGQFALSDVDTVPLGTRCIAHVDKVAFGWVKWSDNKVVERHMPLTADGEKPLKREQLGDTDESRWEVQSDGSRRDPWQFQAQLPLTRCDTDEGFVFCTGSKGGLNAVNKLVRTYGSRISRGAAGDPVIELKSDRYKHHVYGWINYPLFHITNWLDDGGKPLPVDKDLNDQIPF
jgi:hypothetical protein